MKRLLEKILARLARQTLSRYKPEIVAISGSVGKTTTKEAVACVLAGHFKLRENYKNYNNEIGLPLTILGSETAGRSISGWLSIFRHGRALAAGKTATAYPEALVLEMGIDHPGDMDKLIAIARPTRAIMTKLGQAHLEFFSSLEELHKEKWKLAEAVPEDGYVIYNYDDEKLRAAAESLHCRSISFGFNQGADVMAEHSAVSFNPKEGNAGLSFKLIMDGSAIPVFLPGAIGRPSVYAALAAAALSFSYGLNGLEISERLRLIKSPAGRLQLINGRTGSLMIDDTYNASPDSMFEGFAAVLNIPIEHRQRVWAVLGDMRELGALNQEGHEQVGRGAAKTAQEIVTVGSNALMIDNGAKKAGFSEEHIRHFENADQAADFLEKEIQADDLLFVKGSQAVRMEKIVKRLMRNPEQAPELLVRQGKEWDNT